MPKNLQKDAMLCIWNIHFGGRDRCKILFGWYMETIPRISFTKQPSNFCRQMINCMRAWNYLKIHQIFHWAPRSPDKHARHWWRMKKMSWGRNIESHLCFAGYHIFAPAGYIERYMEDTSFRFDETGWSNYGPYKFIWENYQYTAILKMEMEEFVAWFWLIIWYRWNAVYFQSF